MEEECCGKTGPRKRPYCLSRQYFSCAEDWFCAWPRSCRYSVPLRPGPRRHQALGTVVAGGPVGADLVAVVLVEVLCTPATVARPSRAQL